MTFFLIIFSTCNFRIPYTTFFVNHVSNFFSVFLVLITIFYHIKLILVWYFMILFYFFILFELFYYFLLGKRKIILFFIFLFLRRQIILNFYNQYDKISNIIIFC